MAEKKLDNRQYTIIAVFVLSTVVLLLKAAQLQLFSERYRERAEATTIDIQTEYPSRGLLYDRNGQLLAYNDALYDLMVTYNLLSPNMDTTKLCTLLEIDKATFIKSIKKDWSGARYSQSVPFVFLSKIAPEVFSRFQEFMHEFPGFSFALRNVRGYPHKNAAHVLGYISEVDKEQVDESDGLYAPGDYIGTSGIEKQYESYLKGRKGVSFILKDNVGRKVEPFNEGLLDSAAVSGEDLILSLDLDVQSYAEALMQGKKGSIVAIEPESGEILAMLSTPAYDPNLLAVHRDRGRAFANLQKDTVRNPFFDRTVMARYPPGSVIKPIFALIALQEKIITVDRQITCKGGYFYKTYFWGCHARPGVRNVRNAIRQSCNTFFYTTYVELVEQFGYNNPGEGLNKVQSYLNDFGLGRPLGIDIPFEQPGLIPNDDYYKNLYKDENGRWYATYIISNGIGQGEIELSTIQLANLAVVLANRGHFFTPHILKGYKNVNLSVSKDLKTRQTVPIDPQHFEPVILGMQDAINSGTAGLAYVPGIEICGKTGTSENPHGENHSVFFAFAPKEDPKIAIAVYIENAGWGGTYAAPIASLIIEKYLKNEIHPDRQWIEQRMLETDFFKKEDKL